MDFSLISDPVAVCTAKQGFVFGKSLLKRWDFANHISLADSAVDAIAPPSPAAVRSISNKTIRRIRKKRRTKRVLFSGDSDDGGDFGRFISEGDDPFGFGGGGGDGGGKGWNFGGGGFGNENWDESSSSSWSDPAMEFVYEVICWIALSNCVHFAFKRMVRIVTDGEREKLNITLSPVC